jgi:hypothetical protein
MALDASRSETVLTIQTGQRPARLVGMGSVTELSQKSVHPTVRHIVVVFDDVGYFRLAPSSLALL